MLLSAFGPWAVHAPSEHVRSISASSEGQLPWVCTRFAVLYRLDILSTPTAGAGAQVPARFDVQLAQALPFLSFNGAEWQAVVSLRNLVYTDAPDASVFDEISVVRPPKLVAGGIRVVDLSGAFRLRDAAEQFAETFALIRARFRQQTRILKRLLHADEALDVDRLAVLGRKAVLLLPDIERGFLERDAVDVFWHELHDTVHGSPGLPWERTWAENGDLCKHKILWLAMKSR